MIVIKRHVHARRGKMLRLTREASLLDPCVDEPRSDCHRPTAAKGRVVVSSSGRPSVK